MRTPTGSVKREGKQYRARLSYTDRITGRRRYKDVLRDSANEAHDLIKRWRDEWKETGTIASEDPRPAVPEPETSMPVPTVSTLCDLFVEKYAIPAVYRDGVKVRGMKAWKTFRGHVSHIRREIGHVPLPELSFGDLHDMRDRLLDGITWQGVNRSAMYVNRVMSTCRLMLKVGRLRHLMAHNPFASDPTVRLVDRRLERGRDRTASYEEEAALLAQCTVEKRRLHLRLAIVMAVESGMRQAEILHTQRWPVKDADGYDMPYIDWSAGVIHVTWYYSKNKRPRAVPMTERLRREVRQWEVLLPPNDPALFHFETIDTAWRGAKRDAGVKGLRFHDLKSTFVTRAQMAGVPGDLISLVADHADQRLVVAADMTRRAYLSFTPELQQVVAGKLNEQWAKVQAQNGVVN